MRVLIATDVSPVSQVTLNEVAARPWPTGAELRLLHIVDPLPFATTPSLIPLAVKGARETLEKAAESLGRPGINMSMVVTEGHRPRASSKQPEIGMPISSSWDRGSMGQSEDFCLAARRAPSCAGHLVRSRLFAARNATGSLVLSRDAGFFWPRMDRVARNERSNRLPSGLGPWGAKSE